MNIGDFADHWSFANRPDGLGKKKSGSLPNHLLKSVRENAAVGCFVQEFGCAVGKRMKQRRAAA